MVEYKRVQAMRNNYTMTQADVADVLDISVKTYQAYETGRREAPLEVVIKLAYLFHTSVDYLLGRINDWHPFPASKIDVVELARLHGFYRKKQGG